MKATDVLVISLGAAAAALVLASAALHFAGPPVIATVSVKRAASCHETVMEPPSMKCMREGQVAIWGDSMALDWTEAVRKAHGDVVPVTRDSCAPLLNLPGEFPADIKCRAFSDAASKAVQGFDTVYLVGRWVSTPVNLDDTLARVAPTVRRIVVIGPTPTMRHGKAAPRAQYDAREGRILARLRAAAKPYPNVEVLDVSGHFCTATECPPVRNGVALYSDNFHLSDDATSGVLGYQRLNASPNP